MRSGFVQRYHSLSPEERTAAALRSHGDIAFAGLKQEEEVLDWLHDCYFAAVAGDSPTFECWPVTATEGGRGSIGFMHQNILALWGMPLGEMWDLEKLAETCRRLGRWTFFVTSAPANVVGEFSFSSPFPFYFFFFIPLCLLLVRVGLMSMLFRWCEFASECNSYFLVYIVETSFAQVLMLRGSSAMQMHLKHYIQLSQFIIHSCTFVI